jgi:hypothetical protein
MDGRPVLYVVASGASPARGLNPVRTSYKDPDAPDILPPPSAFAAVPATFNTINKWAATSSAFRTATIRRRPRSPGGGCGTKSLACAHASLAPRSSTKARLTRASAAPRCRYARC